jgi:hypothetical protein
MSKQHIVLKNEMGVLRCEISKEGCYFLHFELHKWSKKLFKESLVYFYKWLHTLNEKGVLAVFVLIPEGDDKLYKWEEMFGFKEIDRSGGHILMAQPTGE